MKTFPTKFDTKCVRCHKAIQAGKGRCGKTSKGWKTFCDQNCHALWESLGPEKLPTEDKAPVVQANIGNLSAILQLFAKAQSHLKFPAIEINVPRVAGLNIRISVAGATATEPGSLTVVKADKNPETGRRSYVGNVSKAGEWRTWKGDETTGENVGHRLAQFAADPAGVASEYGRLTGRCCFCNRALKTVESTAVGYGPDCAEHYGLPWGCKPVEFAGPAAA